MKQSAYDAETLKGLSDLCFQVLRADPNPGRMAVPFLHFLSAHPNNLLRYQALLDGKSPAKGKIRNMAGRMRLAAKSWLAGSHLWQGDPLPRRADILFVSHFLRPEQAVTGEDLYFGSLPQDLAQVGISSAVALIDHSDTSWHRLRENWSSNGIPRVLLHQISGNKVEQKSRHLMNETAAALRAEARIEADAKKNLFLQHAAADAGSAASRAALRIGYQVGELVRRLQPKLIVTTFEGHGWERLAFRSARDANPEIICAGYHHAVLFPLQHALSRRLGNSFDPDLILTAGTVTRDYFSNLPDLAGIPLKILGSARAADPLNQVEKPSHANHCLLLPEGLLSESLLFSRLAVRLAMLRPELTFSIRLHPLLSPEKIVASDGSLANLPHNLDWSKGSLEQDLEKSRWTVYRGSSAVIAAVQAGLRPIYYSQEDSDLSIDPLRTMEGWRETASTPESVCECLDRDSSLSPADRLGSWRSAQRFCSSYFAALDPTVISSLVSADPGLRVGNSEAE